MYTSVTLLLFFFFTTTTPQLSVTSSPDHFLKSLHHQHKPQQFIDVTHPLPSDHLTPSCTHTLIHHSFGNTINKPPFTISYSPPSDCPHPWSHVVLDFQANSKGEQYDRIAAIWLGGAELLRTSTAEPTKSGIFWNVRKDITRYSSLLLQSNLNVTMMLENIINDEFTGVYHVNANLLFYKDYIVRVPSKLGFGSNDLYRSPADLIIPVSDDGKQGFWFRIESESNLGLKKIKVPSNTYRAILELYVSFHGNDEFWYSNPPNSYIRMNNLTITRGNGCYREVFVTIDGKFIGSVVPFPVVFTGGINPLFWEPIVAIGAFDLPSYDIDLTPFLEMVLDGKGHEIGIGVTDGISYWLVDANLHVWLDHGSSEVEARSIVFSNPALSIQTREGFKLLDGKFQVGARRKSDFAGWVKSSFGNLTTIVSNEFRFKNKMRFNNNGTYKIVKQNVKVKSGMMVKNEMGNLVSRLLVRRQYPLNVITSTLPATKKDRYLLVTNVSHAFRERCSDGVFSSSVYNSQVSGGWMEVKDHSVLKGEAFTNQSYSYCGEFGCYSRTVAARNGRLIDDNTTVSSTSSF